MIRRASAVLLGLVVAAAAGCGTVYKPKLEPYAIESTDFPLPSGLRVIFQEDHTRPTVTIVSVVDSGSMHDPEGKEGLAHLVEHMCFRARHDGKTQVMDVIKGVGGAFNAYTADERTVYLTTAPKEALAGLLRIEALRLLDPVANIEDKVLDIEREVVRNELRVRTETTIGNKIFEELESMLFPKGHPRHRTGIGTHETLSSITMDDVRAFTREHYTPKDTTIVISGDFDRAQAAALLQAAFPPELVTADGKPVPAGQRLTLGTPKPRVSGAAPAVPKPAETLRRITGPVDEPTLIMAWLVPGGFRGNDILMNTAANYLGSFMGYTMRARSQKQFSLTTGTYCFASESVEATVLMCAAGMAPGDVDIDDMLERARGAPALSWQWADSRSSYDYSRAYVGAAMLGELARESRVERVALHAHYRGGTDAYAQAFAELSALDIEQQRDFFYEHVTRDRMVALIVEPEEKKATDGPAFDASASWSGAVFEGNPTLDAIYARMSPAVIEAATSAPLGEGVVEFTLPNTLPVIIVPHRGAPLVRVALFTHGGYLSTDPPRGWSALSMADDAPEAIRFTGRWQSPGGAGWSSTGLEAPSGNLRAAIEVVAKAIKTRRAFEPGLMLRRRLEFSNSIEARRRAKDPSYAIGVAVEETLYAGHPLSAWSKPYDIETLLKLDKAWGDADLKRTQAPANATLIVVGDIDPAEARALIEANFSDWRAGDVGARAASLPPPPAGPAGRKVLVRSRSEASQAQIVLGCLVDGAPQADAARAVLGAALRTDLWRALRENTGSSYSPSAWASSNAGGNADLTIRATVQTDQAVRSLTAMLGRIEGLSKGEIALADLRNAQWSLARRTLLGNRTPGAVTYTLARALRDGLSVSDLAGAPKALAAVDGAALGAVLEPCVGREVIGVVGPPSLAEALATFGEVTTVE